MAQILILGMGFVFWVVIPLILISIVGLGMSIGTKTTDPEKKTSAKSGWWAGILLFTIFFVSKFSSIKLENIKPGNNIDLSVPAVVLGALLGFFTLFGLKEILKTRLIGILSMSLSFAGSASLFSYFFLDNYKFKIMSFALGLIFGSLLNLIIYPSNAHNLFLKKSGN